MTTATPRPAATAEDLLRRFRASGDADALGALYDLTAPGLLRVALSIAPDAALAENAIQETFLAVLAAPERWDETRPVMPWLLGILHRQVGKVRRDGARRPDPLRLAPALSDDPSAVASSHEDRARVRAAIDELPEPYRAVAVLRWRHGLDPADIADVRGEPPGTTRSLLSRALEKLRERLGGGALALFGMPGTRGLGGIRRALMSKATAAAATGAAVAAGGVIVMKKVAAACGLLLLVAGGAWWAAQQLESSRDEAPTTDATSGSSPAAKKRGRASAEDAMPSADEAPPPVDFDRCDRDLDLFGRVIDEDGKAVAGARVATVTHPGRWITLVMADAWSVTEKGPTHRTASDGTFAIRLARAALVDLHVEADGFTELVRSDCIAGERVTMTLRRGATLDVTTTDEAGAPVPNVTLRLERSAQFDPVMQKRTGVTDAAGRFAFTGLIPGPSSLRLHHPSLGAPATQRPMIPASGTLSLRLTMPAGRVVTGRVTVAGTGAPLAGVRVSGRAAPLDTVVTDADGRYAFPGWTDPIPPILSATAPGYGGVRKRVPAAGEVDFVLTRGGHAIGRVLLQGGTPADGASVMVFGLHSEGRDGDYLTAQTDAGGRFEVDGVQRDIPHWVAASAPGFATTSREMTKPASADGTFDAGDITLPAARSIEGVATDADGRPLADISITLIDQFLGATRRTDDLGRFRFPDLAPGEYRLAIFCADSPRTEPTPVTLPPDRDVRDVRLSLAGSRAVTLLVVDEASAPVAGIDVIALLGRIEQGANALYGMTGYDGRFTVRGMPARDVMFRVMNYATEERYVTAKAGPVVPDGQEIRVVLRRAAVRSGFVRDETGAPVPRLSVKAVLHGDGSNAGETSAGEDGAFSMKVPAGEVIDLRVDGLQGRVQTGWRGALLEVTAPAAALGVVVRREVAHPPGTLSIVLRDSAGGPKPGVKVVVYGKDDRNGTSRVTDSDGRILLEGLPPDACMVTVQDSHVDALDVPPKSCAALPDGQELVLTYGRGVAIRGRVVDAQGRAVPNAGVDVSTRDSHHYSTRCDADGRFTTGGMPEDVHRLSCSAHVGGRYQDGAVVNVMAGGDEITIKLAPRAK